MSKDLSTATKIADTKKKLEEAMKMVEAMVENSAGFKIVMDIGNNTLKINCSILDFEIETPDNSVRVQMDGLLKRFVSNIVNFFSSKYTQNLIVFGHAGHAINTLDHYLTNYRMMESASAKSFARLLKNVIDDHNLCGYFVKNTTESTKEFHRYDLLAMPAFAKLKPKNKIKDLTPLEFDSSSTGKHAQINGFIGEISDALSST